MSKDELYPKITEMPYYGTSVSADRSRAQILRLLESYGIEGHQWTTVRKGEELLKFQLDMTVQGVQTKKMVMIKIPLIKARKWNNRFYDLVEVPRAQTLRIVYYALKAVLETTKYGVFKTEELLMAYILTQLPDGTAVQLKDLLHDHPLLLTTTGEEK